MLTDILAKIGHFIGWTIVVIVGLVLSVVVALIPLSFLPGSYETDFVNMRWVKYILPCFMGGVLVWRFHHLQGERRRDGSFSLYMAAKWTWAMVSGASRWSSGPSAWRLGSMLTMSKIM